MKRISTLLLAMLLLVSMLLMASCDTEPENTTTTTTTTPAATTTTPRPQGTTRPPIRPNAPMSKKTYEVGTKEELINLAQEMLDNNWMQDGITIKLTADIILNDTSDPEWYNGTGLTEWPWAGLKSGEQPFEGTIDGQGHTIYGLYAKVDARTDGTYLAAFVPQATGETTIQNLALRDGYIEATSNQAYYYATATGASNNQIGYMAKGGTYLASFVGYSNASALTIENCYSDVTLRAINNSPTGPWGSPALRVGGMVGFCHNASGIYKFNNLAFYGSIHCSSGTYLKDQNGEITTTETGNGSGIHTGAFMIGNQHNNIAIQVTNTVVAPTITGSGGVGTFLEDSFRSNNNGTPKLQNLYTNVAMFHGNSSNLQKYMVAYDDDWTGEPIETCKANMTEADFQNRALLNLYGADFTWYEGGEFSSTNCWTYDANGRLIQQIFLPAA